MATHLCHRPTVQSGIFILQTLESVLTQGYPDLESIVVHGGSTDEAVEIIREYESEPA